MSGDVIRYSYRHAPTLWKFSQSDAFIRGLLGPFRCLSGDTEFLTPTGWRRLDAFVETDLVAQWSQETNQIEFVKPLAHIVDAADDLIEFDSGSFQMRLSEGHRVPHYDWKGAFTVKTAAEIERKPSRRRIPTTFRGVKQDGLGMSDDMIRFAVMMHADGHYPKHGLVKGVLAFRKRRKIVRARQLLVRLGIEFKEATRDRGRLETTLTFTPPYVGKKFSGRWWSASMRELSIVMDEMIHWDGHRNEICVYSSANEEDADFIQYAAHATGLRASIRRIEYSNPKWRPSYRVHIRMGPNNKNEAYIREQTKIRRVQTSDGKMYCLSVPSGFFVARYNKTVFVTGNSGKSSACCIEILRRAQQQAPGKDGIRRTRWQVVRNTSSELRDTTIKTFMMWAPEGRFGTFNKTNMNYHITGIPGCDIEIMFRALDRPDHIAKLLSLELTGAWFNEAREIPWSIIHAMRGRVRQYPSKEMGGCSWGGIILDTNPPDTESDWYQFFETKDHPAGYAAIFRQPSGLADDAENIPFINGGRQYYLDLCTGAAQDWINVYVNGQYGFTKWGKPVYDEYSDAMHCKAVEPVPGLPIYRGFDFGLSPAATFSQLLPDHRWLIFDEMTSTDMSVEGFLDDVADHSARSFTGRRPQFIDVADPAGEIRSELDKRTCFMIAQAKGFNMQRGIQSVVVRLESVRKPLRRIISGQPQLILHPRCKRLRKGFLGEYHFRQKKTLNEQFEERPYKNDASHVHDALQYPATHIFGAAVMTGLDPERQAELYREERYEDDSRSSHTGY